MRKDGKVSLLDSEVDSCDRLQQDINLLSCLKYLSRCHLPSRNYRRLNWVRPTENTQLLIDSACKLQNSNGLLYSVNQPIFGNVPLLILLPFSDVIPLPVDFTRADRFNDKGGRFH